MTGPAPDPRPTARPAARVLLMQWAGDYREAYRRLAAGGPETYYSQRYSVMEAGGLADAYAAFGVLCLTGTPRYDEELPNRVRAIGAGFAGSRVGRADAAALLSAFRPTHLVLATPQPGVLEWAAEAGVDVLPQFADSFSPSQAGKSRVRRLVGRWRQAHRHRQLGRLLSGPSVRWASNHNVNACRELVQLGMDPARVVPWDWPPVVRPSDFPAKGLADRPERVLVFVGAVTPTKGVGDVVGAVAELRRRGRAVKARIIGPGDVGPFERQAVAAGVAGAVEFTGPLPHPEVIRAMRAADLVLVPSWHAYPEGLPFTIYEALATRTPLVCSDHPAFCDRVGDGVSAVCVPERSPAALAAAVDDILSDPERYGRMSEATAGTWAGLVCPVVYYDVIRRWVSGTPDDDRWLAGYSLASGRYDQPSP